MLHIIGLIFKLIGILILILLGIILLLIAGVLLIPVKYEISAMFPGKIEEIRADVKVSWIFHILRIRWKYENGSSDLSIRPQINLKKKKDGTTDETDMEEALTLLSDDHEQLPEISEQTQETKREEEPAAVEEEKPVTGQAQDKPVEQADPIQIEKEEEESKENKFVRIIKGIIAKAKKIKFTFKTICDKIKMISEKKEKVLEFIERDYFQHAYKRLKHEMVWVKRLLKPKNGRLKLHFGFEDPYYTGLTLAFLSMIYPFMGDHMSIDPDFENPVLEGEFYLKGQIRMIYSLIFGLKLIIDKNVRRTFNEGRILWKNL